MHFLNIYCLLFSDYIKTKPAETTQTELAREINKKKCTTVLHRQGNVQYVIQHSDITYSVYGVEETSDRSNFLLGLCCTDCYKTQITEVQVD